MWQQAQCVFERDTVVEKKSPESIHKTMPGVSAPGIPMADIAMADIATIVVGLGNPILGDDGVGWHIAEQVMETLRQNPPAGPDIVVEFLSLGGLSLMEHLIGYDRAIIIDAIGTGAGPHGSVHCFPLDGLPDNSGGHMTAIHDTSLQTALRVGRSMGAHLPQDITIIGVESPYVYDFSDSLTPLVSAAVPEAVQAVLDILYGTN
jgi:hydrogenase maturation protease